MMLWGFLSFMAGGFIGFGVCACLVAAAQADQRHIDKKYRGL